MIPVLAEAAENTRNAADPKPAKPFGVLNANEDILGQLKTNPGRLPREALYEAMGTPEEITPHLLKILEETTRNVTELSNEPDYMAHIYALFLLA